MAEISTPPVIKLGEVIVTNIAEKYRRISMLLWGAAGSGKTTLAATAPGKKLWILFDPDGLNAVANRKDILVADFTGEPARMVERFKTETGIGLDTLLNNNPDIETIVVDSVTSYSDVALQHGVIDAAKFGATLEDPGYKGYGRKHAWVHAMVINLNRIAAKHKKNIIFICHEDKPEKDKEGNVLYITMLLGSALNVEIPVQLSEIWHLEDTGRERRIAIRATRSWKPMKSRMFFSTGQPEFVWTFDADNLDAPKNKGMTIADWHAQWITAGNKIPLPK